MGSNSDRRDSRGREKIQCRVCGGWFHRVDVHAQKHHNLDGKAYQAKYPGAPLLSQSAQEALVEAPVAAESATPAPASVEPPSGPKSLTFGCATLAVLEEDVLDEYDRAFIPEHDEEWIPDHTKLEEIALGIEDNDNILIVGPPGVGKTTLAKELAALLGQPLRRLPFNGEMRLADLVGKQELTVDAASGQTVTHFQEGPLVDSARRGHWALFDEFDSAPSHVTFVLHAVLEPKRHLALMGSGSGAEVKFHDRFRVIATANTLGYGDETGLYSGTAPMNEALLDRFGVVIHMDYPTPEEELRRISARVKLDKAMLTKMVQVAKAVREAWRSNTTMTSMSPRRTLAWARKTARLGGDAKRAARLTVTNKIPPDDAKFVEGIIQRHFG